jgi:hypothetical protein
MATRSSHSSDFRHFHGRFTKIYIVFMVREQRDFRLFSAPIKWGPFEIYLPDTWNAPPVLIAHILAFPAKNRATFEKNLKKSYFFYTPNSTEL